MPVEIPYHTEPDYHYPPSEAYHTPPHYPTPYQPPSHSLPFTYGSHPANETPMYRPHPPPPQYPFEPMKNRQKRDNRFHGILSQSFRPLSFDINEQEQDKKLTGIVRQIMLEVIEKDQSLGEVNATIKHPEASDLHFHVPLPKQSLTSKKVVESDLPPVITTHELPAPYGCRSIATKMCFKVPMVVPKKIPYEKCNEVPSVDCTIVLKKVPELECVPEVFEECSDVAQDVPYLAAEEKCEEVAYDECVEVR